MTTLKAQKSMLISNRRGTSHLGHEYVVLALVRRVVKAALVRVDEAAPGVALLQATDVDATSVGAQGRVRPECGVGGQVDERPPSSSAVVATIVAVDGRRQGCGEGEGVVARTPPIAAGGGRWRVDAIVARNCQSRGRRRDQDDGSEEAENGELPRGHDFG